MIMQQLPTDSKEMQINAANGFIRCFKIVDVKDEILMDIFMLCVQILGQWNMDVINAWLEILKYSVEKLKWEEI